MLSKYSCSLNVSHMFSHQSALQLINIIITASHFDSSFICHYGRRYCSCLEFSTYTDKAPKLIFFKLFFLDLEGPPRFWFMLFYLSQITHHLWVTIDPCHMCESSSSGDDSTVNTCVCGLDLPPNGAAQVLHFYCCCCDTAVILQISWKRKLAFLQPGVHSLKTALASHVWVSFIVGLGLFD